MMAAFAACGDESTSSTTERSAESTLIPTVDSAPQTSIVAPIEPQPSATEATAQPTPTTSAPTATTVAATTTSTTAPATTESSPAAGCGAAAIFPVVAALFPENEFWNPLAVDVLECQNGYARVIAIADQSLCDPGFSNCLENEQVFVVDAGGSWEYFTSGSGISCGNPSELWPEMITACEALGLP